MRIKVINPNTTQSMTEKIDEAARAVVAAGTEVVTVNPRSGPVSIEGHYDEAVSAIGVLEEVRQGEADGIDAYVIACFGDPGLLAAREIAHGPVIGIAEGAMRAASFVARGFSIVTTLRRACPTLRDLVDAYGMQRYCASIRATDLAVLDLEELGGAAAEKVLEECRRAVVEDSADAILLGCAGMADLGDSIAAELGVPVIDGVRAAVKFAEGMVALELATSKGGDLAWPLEKPYLGHFDYLAPGVAIKRAAE